MPPPYGQSDRNLLLGVLAYQNAFITRDALIAGMQAWLYDKNRSLADVLHSQGALDAARRSLLEALVRNHLERHDGDPQKSLQALGEAGFVRAELDQLADAELQASIAHLSVARPPRDPDSTVSYSVGESTSRGTRFRILRPHAQGGLGQVSVALDSELGREVALKEIQEIYADNPENRARFLLEAEITGGLEHPGIVPVYGLGADKEGRPFYAMRLIKGDSLMDAIEKFHGKRDSAAPTGPAFDSLEFRSLLRRLIDVCNAMQYAHDRGVLHRDLKPRNIMLGKYGETLIVDWGLAKARGKSEENLGTSEAPLIPTAVSDPPETVAGAALGTPAYTSPEQAEGRLDQIGPASDVYSLGATLYCILTGQPPVGGSEKGIILAKVVAGEIIPPRQINPQLGPALEAVCQKAMALRPRDRYASPRDVAQDIEHWLADEPVKAWPEPWTVKMRRWAGKNRTLVAASAAAVLVLILGGSGARIWYVNDRAEQYAEKVARDARLQARKDQVNTAVSANLEEGEKTLSELRARIEDPKQVHVLLSAIGTWEALVERGKQAMLRAKAHAAGNQELLQPTSALRLQKLVTAAFGEEKNYQVVKELDDTLLSTVGGTDSQPIGLKYSQSFARLGLNIAAGDPGSTAAEVARSPIRFALVTALDHWALQTRLFPLKEHEYEALVPTMLSVARSADPEPWRDRFRQETKTNAYFKQLVADVVISEQPPQILAALAWKSGNIDIMRSALAHYPSDFWLHFWLGLLTKNWIPDSAAAHFQAAVAIRPTSYVPHRELGDVFRANKDLPGALAAFNRTIEINPKVEGGYWGLFRAFRDQNDLPGAIAAYKKAIEPNPKYDLTVAYCALGTAVSIEDRVSAIAAYKKAIEIDPKYRAAYIGLGRALQSQKKKDLDSAILAFKHAIEIDPKRGDAYVALGNALLDKRDLAGAIVALNKAVEIDPKHALASRAAAWKRTNDFQKAISDYDELTRLEPNNSGAWREMAWLLATCRDPKFHDGPKAVQAARKILERGPPKSPYIMDTLAAAYARAGNFKEAVLWQERALEDANLPTAIREQFQARLKLYQGGKAYQEE